MAETMGFSTTALKPRVSELSPTVTSKLRTRAVSLPAAANTSRREIFSVPSALTENTRCPGP